MVCRPTLVTCFFDIGRGTWQGYIDGHPLPPYLKRTNEEYFARFHRLTELENQIIVYSEPRWKLLFSDLYSHKKNIHIEYMVDLPQKGLLQHINDIQEKMARKLNIRQPYNPEYWNPAYVLINYLKAWFVSNSIETNLIKTDMTAWVDFGYAREDSDVPHNVWETDLSLDKAHLFAQKPLPTELDIKKIIETNDVTIQGCHIVAPTSMWYRLEAEIITSLSLLCKDNLIDDDQTMWLMSAVRCPELFEIHEADPNDWFRLFRKFDVQSNSK